ncbi:hypothetical protein FHG87_007054 [Trinorchestia longiramus]|nr:hypothetical protein FHG87_007054 [Trinorchestia longiramus]
MTPQMHYAVSLIWGMIYGTLLLQYSMADIFSTETSEGALKVVEAKYQMLKQENSLTRTNLTKRARPGLGEHCIGFCARSSKAECVNSVCVCHHKYPVTLHSKNECTSALLFGDRCSDDLQCQHHDNNTHCSVDLLTYKECMCKPGYEMRDIPGLHPSKICFPGIDLLKADMPTFLGMGLALSMFSAALCLVLKIFSRARYGRTRRYANANIPPPLTVSAVSVTNSSSIGPPIILQFINVGGPLRRSQSFAGRRGRVRGLNRRISTSAGAPRSVRVVPSCRSNEATLPSSFGETYAAFALANSQGSLSPRSERLNRRSSSRRTSYASYRTGSRCPSMTSLRSGELVRTGSYHRAGKSGVRASSRYTSMSSLRSGDLLHSASYIRPGSRRPSMSSLRSGSFAIVDPRGVLDRGDHYLVYIRGPARSLTSDMTNSSSCDTPRVTTPHSSNRSTEQLLAVYHSLAERSPGAESSRGGGTSPGCSGSSSGPTKAAVFRLPSAGTSDAHRSISSEDVFLEEQEEEEEEEEEVEEEKKSPDCQVLIEEDEESDGETSAVTKLVK